MFPLDSSLFCLLSEMVLSHCLPLWIPGTYFLLETIENVKEHFQNIDLCSFIRHLSMQQAHTGCDIPVLRGDFYVQFKWATPVQWTNLRL